MPRKKLSLEEIDLQLTTLSNWKLVGNKIEKSFAFNNFIHAWGFMSQVALLAEKFDHHPDWTNFYNKVDIALNSHDADGLTETDFTLAHLIDEIASDDNKI